MTSINSSNIKFGAAGNLIAGSGSGTTSLLALGSQYQILSADSSQSTGLKWVNASSPTTAWTPVVVGQTTPGTATYTAQQGFYTQVGILVFISGYVSFNGFTGTGTLSIPLPVAVFSPAGTVSVGTCIFDGAYTSGSSIEATGIGGTLYVFFSNFGSGSVVGGQACVPAANLYFSLIYPFED